jgi:gamma-glutamylaminecyclotransferase
MPGQERRLFVYGTLLSGEPGHARLQGAGGLGAARTEPIFQLVDLGPYPALVADGSTAIVGELYLVDTRLIVELDVFEQVPVLFRRVRIPLDDGSQAEAYAMDVDQVRGRRRLHQGDWRKRFATTRAPSTTPFARWARGRIP